MPEATWEENIESRISRLESEVSKSNLSDGLALSLENIMKKIDELMPIVDKDPDGILTPVVNVSMVLIKKAFELEASRLRKKG